jgi:hypothetical protein
MPETTWDFKEGAANRMPTTHGTEGAVIYGTKPTPVPPEILVHFKIVCSCGAIIVQCRCGDMAEDFSDEPTEKVEVRHGCRACRSDMQDAAELIAKQNTRKHGDDRDFLMQRGKYNTEARPT